ncbi:MAG: hypothetical protein KKC39_00015 [Candidatus Omnitrophica bacterium]|nr:hypothetical protein [Candidatus Omnitrophota bacterium]MBU4467118.1 hypothetical protein [Candidatus Omnitrophota bacterium]MCG2708382.1 hypothetical protein [Candidatus Omnitrophota bacterium]
MKTMKAPLRKQEVVEVKERFMSIDTRSLDSKHRITLGGKFQRFLMNNKMKIDAYKVFICKSGDLLLRPEVSIPSSEAWIYQNPQVIGRVRKGLQEAAEGKVKRVSDLESFLNDL